MRKRPQIGRSTKLTMMIDPDLKLAVQMAARAEGVTMASFIEATMRSTLTTSVSRSSKIERELIDA